MKLTFDAQAVAHLIEMTEALPVGVSSYSAVGDYITGLRKKGLQLVGDRGVYVMSNAENQPTQPDSTWHFVCYADQVNPLKMEVDDWLEAKQASFGRDDGSEFIPIDDAKRWVARAINGKCVLAVSSDSARLRDTQGAWRYKRFSGLRPAGFDDRTTAARSKSPPKLTVVK